MAQDLTADQALFQFLLRMGDNTLILGHRVSEWCGHAPVLEEDIALANTALDLIGQTQMWLGLAAEVQGEEKSADDLAFLRDVWDFRNVLLVEVPDADERSRLLTEWRGLQARLYVSFADGSKVFATFDPAQVGDDRISAVQYLRFQVEGQTPVAIGTDFEGLESNVTFTSEQIAALTEDLARL